MGKRPERWPVVNADPAVVTLRKDTFLCVHTWAVAGREPLPHAHNLCVAGPVSLSHTPPPHHTPLQSLHFSYKEIILFGKDFVFLSATYS